MNVHLRKGKGGSGYCHLKKLSHDCDLRMECDMNFHLLAVIMYETCSPMSACAARRLAWIGAVVWTRMCVLKQVLW